MDNVFFIAALVSMGAVVIALFVGMHAMARGTEKDHQLSQKMMRMRILSQGLAIFFLFLAFLTKK